MGEKNSNVVKEEPKIAENEREMERGLSCQRE